MQQWFYLKKVHIGMALCCTTIINDATDEWFKFKRLRMCVLSYCIVTTECFLMK